MSEYEIGKDLQELRSRLERVEANLSKGGLRPCPRQTGLGAGPKGGIDVEKEPILWKPRRRDEVPAFVYGLLGQLINLTPGRPHPKIEASGVQIKTFACLPEPLILIVNWYAGGSDEYARLSNQAFSVVSFADPNSNVTSAFFTYSANLTASGKGSSPPFSPNPPSEVGSSQPQTMTLELRSQGGAVLSVRSATFTLACNDNYLFNFMANFDPGLFELVTGGSWQIGGVLDRC